MTHLHIDFETRSACDLKVAGLDNYAKHPTTDVWCMAYAFGDEPVGLLAQWDFPFKARHDIANHVTNGGIVVAHNAAFELAIWNNVMVPRYGWPELKPEQVRCTMAMAYAMALPGALENAGAALGLAAQKDMAGSRVMLQRAKPKSVGKNLPCLCDGSGVVKFNDGYAEACNCIEWHDDPAKIAKLHAYCKQDVEVERQVESRLLPLPPSEQALWLLDQRINNRGIYVDLPAVNAAIKIVEVEQARLNHEMRVVTKNAVATCNAVGQLGDWLKYRGVEIAGVAKADVLDALDGDPPPDCRRALELRREAAKSSTAKLKKMVEVACADSRIRNWAQYHGAGTGRWAHRNIQPGNLPRPNIPQQDIEFILDNIDRRDAAAFIDNLYGSVLDVISSCLRGFLTAAPGYDLIAGDYSNIEGRTLAWLAGEEWKLQAFRDFDNKVGPDLYLVMAAAIYGVPVASLNKKSPERQDGKTGELAFGYQGGVGAWRKMESNSGVDRRSDDEVNAIKDKWRAKHPKIVSFWYDLEKAAVSAVRQPGVVFAAGHPARECKFIVKGSFLWCKLPSGRNLCYAYPVLKEKETPWGEMKEQVHYKCVDSVSRKWGEASLYGGELANNVTQAVARDLLAHGMTNLEAAGFPVVLHVHDEVVVEVPQSAPSDTLAQVERIMKTLPAWADGLPVATEGWRGRRYRK